MKWPNSPNTNQGKPFLVLPPLGCRSVSAEPPGVTSPMVTMPPVTGTWPLKKKKCNKRKSIRPKTATLERPILLDIGMLNKIDMSLVKKEFLCVANLCRLTVRSVTPLRAKRPRSLQKELDKPKDMIKSEMNNKWTRKVTKIKKINDVIKQTCKSKSVTKTPQDCEKDKNKKNEEKTPRNKENKNVEGDNEKNNRKVIVLVQPPCTTCGRNEQPERFHSHPNPKSPIKNDKKTRRQQEPEKEPATPVKKSLTCYICAREFGSASLQLHEPQCLKKWERENNLLPKHMRRKRPVKPDVNFNSDKWNQLAWEASQAALCPCENCGRTFLADRLAVHQRSCRPPVGGSRSVPQTLSKISTPPPSSPGPPAVRCYICGRLFGTKSIGIHEPQCLKKWKFVNDQLPPNERKPLPVKPVETLEPIVPNEPEPEPSSSSKPVAPEKPTLECYVCKQPFSPSVIYDHEKDCIIKFRAQNEKLPPEKRLPEPQRGDVKFTPSGGVDFVGTFNRIWENHLAELVPCRICGRRFFPDRIEKHEKACNNLPIKRKKK